MATKNCESCGNPMSKAKDHGGADLANPSCHLCTDERGRLKPKEVIAGHFAGWIWKTAKTKKGAHFIAEWIMSTLPAWQKKAKRAGAANG